jgi:alkaline phosphatase D
LRGYVTIDLGQRRATARFRAIADVRDPNSTVSTLRTFVVEDGVPGPQPH